MNEHPNQSGSFPIFLGLFFLTVASALAESGGIPLILDPAQCNQVEVKSLSEGEYEVTTTGGDPFLIFRPIAGVFDAKKNHVLAFDYFCPDGIEAVEVFFGQPFSGARMISGTNLPKAEGYQPMGINLQAGGQGSFTSVHRDLRLDLGLKSGIHIRLRNFVLRAPTPAESRSAAEVAQERSRIMAAGKAVADYLDASYPATIASVGVTRDEVQISGTIPAGIRGARLAEIAPHRTSCDPAAPKDAAAITTASDGSFHVKVPRFVGGRDRLAQRWIVLGTSSGSLAGRPLSPASWPTDITRAALREMPRQRPANQKGLSIEWTSEIMSDFEELGITAGAINFSLPAEKLLAEPNAPGATPFEHNGKTWWFAEAAFRNWDRSIKWGSDRNMVLSGILLIPPKDSGILLHPDFKPSGIYSMPNLTTQESTDLYRALVAFLAERYSRPDGKFGHIAYWIIHNEVDYGWDWTNMGEQSVEVYLDTYVRSMRLVALEAGQWNPNVQVFISLTHNWDYQPSAPLQKYAPRRMLDLLAKFSAVEGDFPWGVAYHPYPESLFNPATWNDRHALLAFDTPMITPKNLEVLDAYLRQPRFLYHHKDVRTVLLSEQGFHSKDYSEASQRLQAAGLVYTFEKLKQLPIIESFYNHRWIDHPGEGGLKVGLRQYPESGKPYGPRKMIFDVYRAIGTPAESQATAFALSLIGVKSFDDIKVARPDSIPDKSR